MEGGIWSVFIEKNQFGDKSRLRGAAAQILDIAKNVETVKLN